MIDWSPLINFALGAIGTGLGVFNTYTGYRRSVRRIAIQCSFEKALGSEISRLRCQVINPGTMPVTVAAVRVSLIHEGQTHETAIFGNAEIEKGLLGELKPGARRVAVASATYEPFFLRVRGLYVETECGKIARVKSRMLRQVQRKLGACIQEAGLRNTTEGGAAGQATGATHDLLTGETKQRPRQTRRIRSRGIE